MIPLKLDPGLIVVTVLGGILIGFGIGYWVRAAISRRRRRRTLRGWL